MRGGSGAVRWLCRNGALEHSRDLLAAAEYVDDRPLVGVVGIVVLREGLADQGVGTDGELVAEAHLFFNFFIERSAKDSDDDQGDAEVDDIASVASGVAVVEVNHGAEQILMALAGDDATSTDELGNDGEDHQRRENGGHDRVEVRDLPRDARRARSS